MESNGKLGGFIKRKLTPLCRAAKTAPAMHYTNKPKPNHVSSGTTSVYFRLHQDYMVSQPKQVSFFVPANKNRKNLSQIDNFFDVPGDESVDTKAATYISSVQERFKLERNNSERIKLREVNR